MDLKKSIIFIFALGLTLVISDIIHESGHAFFGVIAGLELVEFAPYPHIENGEIYLGHVAFESYDVSSEYLALMYLGSAIFQGGMFILLLIVYFFLNKKDILPPTKKSKKFYQTIFVDYSIKLYSIWG